MENKNDKILELSPPWYTYHRKVMALFGRDTQVHIKDLKPLSDGNYGYMVLVEDMDKAQAIKTILPEKVELGNITIQAAVLGPDENSVAHPNPEEIEVYKTAFSGNPILEKITTISFGPFFTATYCIFKKEVIQFWNDDLSDYRGNYSGLATDIAKEILIAKDISFCTSVD